MTSRSSDRIYTAKNEQPAVGWLGVIENSIVHVTVFPNCTPNHTIACTVPILKINVDLHKTFALVFGA